ncbi:DUF7713 domain-containing protein [Terrihalobacillus insolitus]|uniref:DUF7713 domain-containing protein n=1 Tax=Terrihalobacillus insolitus TaxID=2950438 RepID=UPI00234243A5|nr:hypothetical protein [Terrihalobacillus insolitus]MDC3411983.1 hypothetical protein [Terrihalobacillus insolitus]
MDMCDVCKKNEANITLTNNDDSQEIICRNCFNDRISEEVGVELESQPQEISEYDVNGIRRDFKVEQRIFPNGIFIEATENIQYGYSFAVHGDLGCNQTELFQQLVDKVKLGISIQYTKVGTFANGQKYHSIVNDHVVGLIDYDERSESCPMVVIDGKPYTWEQLGKMAMSYEGFQFQLKFFDKTEDVE